MVGVAKKSGIGRDLVHAFLRNGYCVGGIDNMELEGEDLIEQSSFTFVKANITSESDVNTALEIIFRSFGHDRVTALINNAAISSPYLTATTSAERIIQWKNYININLTGAFIVTQLVLPHFLPGSSVLHISSTRAHQSEPNCEGYAASKAGLLGLTHSQAISFAAQNIRVNCILPGWIDTNTYPTSESDRQWHCVGRLGTPRDISELCIFLCDNDRAGFITGQEFVIDGGVTKKMVYP